MRGTSEGDSRVAAFSTLACFAVGLGLPDLDFVLPLGHRSALTHGVLPILLAMPHPERRRLVPGLALGIGVHLSADGFPNAMTGFALVKLPLRGALPPVASYIWLGANALVALAIGTAAAFRVLPRRMAVALLCAVAAGGVAYLLATDGGWPALALFGGAGWAGWRFHRRRVS